MPVVHEVPVTTDSSGAATVYSGPINGRVLNVIYEKTDFADTVDFTITLETTGQTVWTEENVTASKTVAPRQATHSTAGVAALYAATGTAVNDHVYAARERVKIVVANGGATKTGTFKVIADE